MSLTKFTSATNFIQSLADKPAQSSTELKREFDKVGTLLKEYINDVLTEELDSKESNIRQIIQRNSTEISGMLNKVYPVGSIYMSVNNVNPETIFGGTWVSWGAGRVPVGVSASETEFNTVEKTGGAKTHILTVQQMPSHGHSVSIPSSGSCTISSSGGHSHTITTYYKNDVSGGGNIGRPTDRNNYTDTRTNQQIIANNTGTHTHTVPNHTHTVNQSNAGGGQAHNNLQPYITCYMWKRTA